MFHALSCAAPLAYLDYSAENQGSHTLFEVMGMIAHIPSCPATLGASAWLMSGPGPHPVNGLSCGPNDEEAKALSMPRMIPCVGFERPLQFALRYEWQGRGVEPPYLAISIFSKLEQKHPSSPLILKLALLHCS
jgi:hypothetical protein